MWIFRRYIREVEVKAKIEQMLSTICPNNFNFFIAGGMLTSLFSNQKVNDIDIFFSSLEDYNNLHGYLKKKIRRFETANAVTFYRPISDQTLFPSQKQTLFANPWSRVEKFQLIKKFMTPEETIKRFDFTVCSAAYVPRKKIIIKNRLFLPHIKDKILEINEGKDLWLSYKRVEKYKKKGFKFTGDLTSFCSRCHHRYFCLVNKTQKCKSSMAEYNFV